MKKNNLTEIVFILDRSGSMAGLEGDTIGGFNSLLKTQKAETGKAYVSTVLFDHESIVLHDRVPIDRVPEMTYRDYTVRGCTALLDAVGDAIRHIKNIHKYARRSDVPQRTMFVITTDGMENASRRYSSDEVKRMIREQKSTAGSFCLSARISTQLKQRAATASARTEPLTTTPTRGVPRLCLKPLTTR